MILPNHHLSLRGQCDVLDIHKSSVFYCPKEKSSDTFLLNRIHEIHYEFPYYGYRKICWVLNQEDILINHKKVQRLMQEAHIKALYPGPKLSIPSRDNQVYPYLLKGLEIITPNHVWAVDITYIKLHCGMIYLFALIDWYSRFIVGHKVVNTMEAEHGIAVLSDAVQRYGCPDIANADQGSQFTSELWILFLKEHNIQISHDGVGRCHDNIRIERFWRSAKYEDVFLNSYQSLKEAREGIAKYIEHYNTKRPHQNLDYLTPLDVYKRKA